MSDTSDLTTNSSRPLHVFLCHSSADKPAVRELYQRLKADGFAPWLDEENLIPGQDWRREIPRAVRDSDVVIVCLSKGSTGKAGYVQKEIGFALDVAEEQPEDTIFIIPLKLEECKVPDRLSRWHWVNYFASNGYGKLLRALHARAESLEIATVSHQATERSQESISATQPTPDTASQSGGVNVDADKVGVGEDVIGRDKVVSAGGHIIHAEPGSTVIINELVEQEAKAQQATRKKAVQEQRALKRAATVAAFNQRLRKIFTRSRIFGGLIALGVSAGLYIVVTAEISRNNAVSISATQTAIAIAALPSSTPSSTATSTSTEIPTSTRTPTATSTSTQTPTVVTKSPSPMPPSTASPTIKPSPTSTKKPPTPTSLSVTSTGL
jgi:hypothetical protein